ncbi:MAG: SCO family protein [Clostridia bacterium]|nr:SCO family protein [Deltaproteobacteria bacterium]
MTKLTHTLRTCAAVFATAAALAAVCSSSFAQDRAEPLPKELDGVGITEKLGASVEPSLSFTDSEGKAVTLDTYLKIGKPVVLTMNYSDCPMLCSLQLNQFVQTLREMKWLVGENFQVLTVSLDPNELPSRAAATKARYVKDYASAPADPANPGVPTAIDEKRRAAAQADWNFVVGSDANVHALADTVGFGYKLSPDTKEYLHVAAMMLLTPDGRVSRYMYGLMQSPETLRLSLVEASEGKTATTIDKVLLFCFHYDAKTGQYAPLVNNIMRLGGTLTVLALGVFLGSFWWKEKSKMRAAQSTNPPGKTGIENSSKSESSISDNSSAQGPIL